MANFEFFKCEKCGTTVIRTSGDKTPVCCGESMTLLEAGTVDAAKEKHVPHVVRNGNHVEVQVGEVIHPMTERASHCFHCCCSGEQGSESNAGAHR
jgi:superoxide reductase